MRLRILLAVLLGALLLGVFVGTASAYYEYQGSVTFPRRCYLYNAEEIAIVGLKAPSGGGTVYYEVDFKVVRPNGSVYWVPVMGYLPPGQTTSVEGAQQDPSDDITLAEIYTNNGAPIEFWRKADFCEYAA